MQLKAGAVIQSAAGERLGELDRVVVDPKTRMVTHLIVRKGLLFPTDRVLPMEWVETATADAVVLRPDIHVFDDLPEYHTGHYIQADAANVAEVPVIAQPMPMMYMYPPAAGGALSGPPAMAGRPAPGQVEPYQGTGDRGQPDRGAELKTGDEVLALNGERAGSVERVIADPDSGEVTHFVISQGLVLRTRKLIPAAWVLDVRDGEAHLAVGRELLESLQAYEPEQQPRD